MISSEKGKVNIEGDNQELLVDTSLLLCGLLETKVISKDGLIQLVETVVEMADKIKPDSVNLDKKNNSKSDDELFRNLFFGGK